MNNNHLLEALDEASSLASDLRITDLEFLIETQKRILTDRSVFALFVGPASSGKTSAVNALLGESAICSANGEAILQEGVAPTTAQVVEVKAQKGAFLCQCEYADGSFYDGLGPGEAYQILRCNNRRLIRAVITFPGSELLPESVTLVDTPGFGAYDSEETDLLVEEALGIADHVFLFVRASRGLSEPLKKVVSRLKILWERTGKCQPLSVVLTDTGRLPERVEEVKEHLPKVLGESINDWIQVPRYGCIESLSEKLRDLSTGESLEQLRSLQAVHMLDRFFLPGIEARLLERKVASEKHLENLPLYRKQLEKIQSVRTKISKSFDSHHEKALAHAGVLVSKFESTYMEGIENLIDSVTFKGRAASTDYFAELREFTTSELHERFSAELSELSLGEMKRFISENEKYFEEMETFCASGPEFDIRQDQSVEKRSRLADIGLRKLLGYSRRLGGRGGVVLGMMNVARKAVSKVYHLFGRRAPADLIRRGIPRIVKPFAKVLKNAGLPIQIALEVLPEVHKITTLKRNLRKQATKSLKRWLEPEKKRKKGCEPWKGALETAKMVINDHWNNKDSGLRAQLNSAFTLLDRSAEDYRKEMESLEVFSEKHVHLETRLCELQLRVREWRPGNG